MDKPVKRVTDFLSRDEIKDLHTPTNTEGFIALGWSWFLIAFSFFLVAMYPVWWTVVIAIVLLGGRQLALAVLMHECAHRSLFRSRALNDWMGKWLCAEPTWNHLVQYRLHHLGHHRFTGTEKDPDLGLNAPFPATTGSLIRKVLRDLTGVAGLRRIFALFIMDIGLITYTASTNARPVPKNERPLKVLLANAFKNLGPVVLTNALLFGILAFVGFPALYLLWVAAYFTTYSLFLRIRSVAEHACTSETSDFFRNTRTLYANPLARLTVAPHRVNYHLEHHLLMSVPHYRLKRMHAMLLTRGALTDSPIASGYFALLRRIHKTPAPV